MRTSLLIKGLQNMITQYGDLPVELCIGTLPDKKLYVFKDIYLRTEHYVEPKKIDVISISDFPY